MKTMINFIILCALLQGCTHNQPVEDTAIMWWTTEDRQWILSELERTTSEVIQEITALNEVQWNFREDSTRWSIAEIIEHLEMQNQLHYRELTVVSRAPRYLEFRVITEGTDVYFSNYATDTVRGKSQWFLEPLGRFRNRNDGELAFLRARQELIKFVDQTEIDLRKQFTFRTAVQEMNIEDVKIGQVRDLHQLLITGIAHTDRHLRQIRNIKAHPDFPN